MSGKINYKKIILMTIASAGVLVMAVVAPNALQIFGPFIKNRKKYDPTYYLNRKTKQLIRGGFLKVAQEDGKSFVSLTNRGEKKLLYYQTVNKNIPKKWDKKWRVVIFDIWEKSRVKRNILRHEIKNFGFIQLQRSVWIYPYECSDFIELLKTDLSFGKNIRYMIVDELDHDENLREHFKLND